MWGTKKQLRGSRSTKGGWTDTGGTGGSGSIFKPGSNTGGTEQGNKEVKSKKNARGVVPDSK